MSFLKPRSVVSQCWAVMLLTNVIWCKWAKMSKTTDMVLLKLKMKTHFRWPHLCPRSCSSRVAHGFFPSSHDRDHLLPSRLPHKPFIDNPGHIVVASAQPSPCWHALWLGLIHATKTPQDAQTSEGVSLHPLRRQGDSSLGTAAADVPEELLDQASVALRAGVRSTDCHPGGFPCSRRLSCWTDSLASS